MKYIIAVLAIISLGGFGLYTYLNNEPAVGGGLGSIEQLSQWASNSGYITQNVANKLIKLTGYESAGDCLVTDANGVVSTSTCGGGGGSSKWTDTGAVIYPTGGESIEVSSIAATSTTGTSTFAGAVTVGGQSQINIGVNPTRPLVSTTSRTITVGVGKNYTTIQEALDTVPYFLAHPYRINIDAGNYTSENIIVWPSYSQRVQKSGTEIVPLIITGSSTNPTSVKVGSVFVTGFYGDYLGLNGLELQNVNPYDNEDAGLAIYSSNQVGLNNINFNGGVNGLLCYGSNCMIEANVNFGQSTLSGNALVAKRFGRIKMDNGYPLTATGTVSGYAYEAQGSGFIDFNSEYSNLSGTLGLVDFTTKGSIYDVDTDISYTLKGVKNYNNIGFAIGTTSVTTGLTLDVMTLNTGNMATFRNPNLNNGTNVSFTIGKAPTSDNGFALTYLHNSASSSRYLNFKPIEGVLGTGITINANGNVGVGTTTPISLFSVVASTTGGSSIGQFISPLMNTANQNSFFLGKTTASSNGFNILYRHDTTASNRYLNIKPNESGLGVGILINANGNVGIGTTTPATALSVVGTTTTTGLSISTTTNSTLNIYIQSLTDAIIQGVGNITRLIVAVAETLFQGNVRITGKLYVATTTYNGATTTDAVVIDGYTNSGEWIEEFCTTPTGETTQLVADTLRGCGRYAYSEDGAGALDFVVPTTGTSTYFNLQPGATGAANAAGDGMGINWASGLDFGDIQRHQPAMEFAIRQDTMANATGTFIQAGITSAITINPDFAAEPAQGFYVLATSTQANFLLACNPASGATTYVDTGIASSTTTTANANPFVHFRLEVGGTANTAVTAILKGRTTTNRNMTQLASCTLDLSASTQAVSPVVGIGKSGAGTSSDLHLMFLKFWYKQPVF